MMALSLQEAADQAGISKIDVWRAIQSGCLPALKTRDNGYIIDPNELFRVFERPGPSLSPEPPALQEPSAADKQAAETDAAMAAIAAELKLLLGERTR